MNMVRYTLNAGDIHGTGAYAIHIYGNRKGEWKG